jgi:hypothetical protein
VTLQRGFWCGPRGAENLKIPSHKQTLQLQWKDSILDTPIFRNKDGTTMRYDPLRERLGRLGTAIGYPDVLSTLFSGSSTQRQRVNICFCWRGLSRSKIARGWYIKGRCCRRGRWGRIAKCVSLTFLLGRVRNVIQSRTTQVPFRLCLIQNPGTECARIAGSSPLR